MIDYCSSKRIFTLVLALIGFSVLVFVVEEYAEENEADEHKIRTLIPSSSNGSHPHADCWLHEPFEVLQSCLQCSDFEINAIKAGHCTSTGYFDRVNCTQSGVQALRPCSSKEIHKRTSFYTFCVINAVLLGVSYVTAIKRKEHLEKHAYMRVAQRLDE